MPRRRRPAGWQQERIDLAIARRRHLADPPQDCRCAFCLDEKQLAAMLAAQRERTLAEIGEPPF